MINKILLVTTISFLIFSKGVSADQGDANIGEKPFIIPRASWGANSQYNSKNDIYWQNIYKARASYIAPERSQADIDYANQKNDAIEGYLYGNFLNQFTSVENIREKNNGEYTYVWPLKYTNYVDSIVVHHTHSEYNDDLTGLQGIHRYHSLSNQWGDIGYNYIIGNDGKIYEGREGGDYVVGAHSKYNNFGTVGIALIGNYETEGINTNQYLALEKLIQYLIVHYGIDLSKERYYHRTCSGSKCDTFFLETYLQGTLIGHRDATHTTCPGEKLYEQIDQIRSDNLVFSSGRELILRNNELYQDDGQNSNTSQIQKILKLLRKYSPEEKQNIIDLIDIKKNQTTNTETIKKLQTIRLATVLSLKE